MLLSLAATRSGMLLLGAGALAVAAWLAILVPRMVEASRTGRAHLNGALLYVVGVGQAALVVLDPAFERGFTATGSSLHDATSQLINLSCVFFAVLCLIAAAHDGTLHLPAWALGLAGCGLALPISGLVNGGYNWRSLIFPLVVLALAQSKDVPLEAVLRHLRRILRLVMFGSLLWLAVDYGHATLLLQGRQVLGIDQLAGLTRHPNGLGPLAALAFASEVTSSRGRQRVACAAAALTVCLFAQSRAGWLATAIVVLVVVARSVGPRLAIPGSLLLVCATAILAGKANALGLRVDLNGRGAIWSVAWDVARQHPMLGAGPDALTQQVLIGRVAAVGTQAHNQFLDTLAKTGVVGLLGVVTFLASALRVSARRAARADLFPLVLILTLVTDSIFESPLELKLLPLACVAVLAARPRAIPAVGEVVATAETRQLPRQLTTVR